MLIWTENMIYFNQLTELHNNCIIINYCYLLGFGVLANNNESFIQYFNSTFITFTFCFGKILFST